MKRSTIVFLIIGVLFIGSLLFMLLLAQGVFKGMIIGDRNPKSYEWLQLSEIQSNVTENEKSILSKYEDIANFNEHFENDDFFSEFVLFNEYKLSQEIENVFQLEIDRSKAVVYFTESLSNTILIHLYVYGKKENLNKKDVLKFFKDKSKVHIGFQDDTGKNGKEYITKCMVLLPIKYKSLDLKFSAIDIALEGDKLLIQNELEIRINAGNLELNLKQLSSPVISYEIHAGNMEIHLESITDIKVFEFDINAGNAEFRANRFESMNARFDFRVNGGNIDFKIPEINDYDITGKNVMGITEVRTLEDNKDYKNDFHLERGNKNFTFITQVNAGRISLHMK